MEVTSSWCLMASQAIWFYCSLSLAFDCSSQSRLPHHTAEHFKRGSHRPSNLQQPAELFWILLEKNPIWDNILGDLEEMGWIVIKSLWVTEKI